MASGRIGRSRVKDRMKRGTEVATCGLPGAGYVLRRTSMPICAIYILLTFKERRLNNSVSKR